MASKRTFANSSHLIHRSSGSACTTLLHDHLLLRYPSCGHTRTSVFVHSGRSGVQPVGGTDRLRTASSG
jgi:hypothetical protein